MFIPPFAFYHTFFTINFPAPKITVCLKKEGETISEKTVGNYMREMGIKAQYIKHYTVTTVDSDFSSELKNILNEQINPEEPDAFWCSDITYIWTFEGFTYLTSIMDLFSRKSGSHKGNEEKLLEESISMG
jgi:Transposase and inactivated derivatives